MRMLVSFAPPLLPLKARASISVLKGVDVVVHKLDASAPD
jgi:hypothetical protein